MVTLTGNRCLCSGCLEMFRAPSTFDRHRVGKGAERRCMTAEEMRADGMRRLDGIWRGEARPESSFGGAS